MPDFFDNDDLLSAPLIRGAAQSLLSRGVITKSELQSMAQQARSEAFTVARIETAATLEAIRDALGEAILQGPTLEGFRGRIDEILPEGTTLSPGHVETVFRTNVQSAWSAEQDRVMSNPAIGGAFPYVEYVAVHDDRTRKEHLELETLGLDGTNVYRRDDPVFQAFMPPWDFNCRCLWNPITVEQAARRGVREAQEWLKTGQKPASPQYVAWPDFRPPVEFRRSGTALSLMRLGWMRETHHPETGKKYRSQKRHVWKDDATGKVDRSKVKYFDGPAPKKSTATRSGKSPDIPKVNQQDSEAEAVRKGKDYYLGWKALRYLEAHPGLGLSHVWEPEVAREALQKHYPTVYSGMLSRFARLDHRQEQANDSSPDKPDHNRTYTLPVGSIHVDPERFQYKLVEDKSTGTSEELKEVETFNPDFAGVISVWKDPQDGKTYVVNGHHRVELARRTGHPRLDVRYLRASSDREARSIGALINIAEGRGTAVDAAKFMRDTGATEKDFKAQGISLKGKVAQDAAHLRHLSDRLFDRLALGLIDERTALAISRHLHHGEDQEKLYGILEDRENQGKPVSDRVAEEMAREMASAPRATRTEATLFGDYELEESLFVERNDIKSHVRREIARSMSDFRAVANRRRADRVAGAGNVLDTEANREQAGNYERTLNAFDTLVNRTGSVSALINQAAQELFHARSKAEQKRVREKAFQAIGKEIAALVG